MDLESVIRQRHCCVDGLCNLCIKNNDNDKKITKKFLNDYEASCFEKHCYENSLYNEFLNMIDNERVIIFEHSQPQCNPHFPQEYYTILITNYARVLKLKQTGDYRGQGRMNGGPLQYYHFDFWISKDYITILKSLKA